MLSKLFFLEFKMNTTIFVLLMILSTYKGGVNVVQQEFNSLENCEAARIVLQKAHNGDSLVVRAQGCFKK